MVRTFIVEDTIRETEKRKSVELAKKMLSKNKPIEEIIEFTELTEIEIKDIQTEKKFISL